MARVRRLHQGMARFALRAAPQCINSGIELSGKPKSNYSRWNALPRGGAWNRAICLIAEMLANALMSNRCEC